jgi:hypothetical protein
MASGFARSAPLTALLFSGILSGAALATGCAPGEIVGSESPGGGDADTSGLPPGSPDAGSDPGDPDAATLPATEPDGGSAGADAATTPPAPLTECPGSPSIDRLQQWLASGEGLTVPATGSLLVADGSRYDAKVQFVGSDWHVVVVWVGNQFEAQADFSGASGFTLTYSASDDLYVQLRPASHWSGGDKYVVAIPSTGGQIQTRTFSFDANAWTTLPELGVPNYPFSDAIKEVRGFVFVGNTPNTLDFRGLRIDGFVPTCL